MTPSPRCAFVAASVLLLPAVFAVGCAGGEDGRTGAATPTSKAPHAAPIESAPETLRLALVEQAKNELAVDLHYLRRDDQAGQRAVELHVSYPAETLALAGSEALAATTAAAKQLVAQDQGGTLRVIVYGTASLAELDSGPLARLRFRRLAGGPATLAIDTARLPVFAPAPANEGLRFGAPLVIDDSDGGQ